MVPNEVYKIKKFDMNDRGKLNIAKTLKKLRK